MQLLIFPSSASLLSRIIVLLSLILPIKTSQAQHYDELVKKAFTHLDNKEFEKALPLGQEVYNAFPDDINASVICANSLINLGEIDDAGGYITVGLKRDPTNFSLLIDASCYFAAKGNMQSAKSYLTQSMKFFPELTSFSELQNRLVDIGRKLNQAETFNTLAIWYSQNFKPSEERFPTIMAMLADDEAEEQNSAAVSARFATIVDHYTKMAWHEMVIATYTEASSWLNQRGRRAEALRMAEAGYTYYLKYGCGDNFDQVAGMYFQLLDSYDLLGNFERMIQFSNEIMELSPKLLTHTLDVRCMILLSSAYDRLNRNADARTLAEAAFNIAKENGFQFGVASAANSVCVAYSYEQTPDDTQTALSFGEFALKQSYQYKFESLTPSIISNLAIVYWKLGTREARSRSMQLHGALVQLYKEKKLYGQAANTLNNAGSLFFVSNQFDEAARLYEESISLAKLGVEDLSPEEKLTFYQSHISAYQFLTVCYAQLKNAEKTFAAMEGSRGRVLAERLAKGSTVQSCTLEEYQSSLQPDEACIMYSLFSGHEVTILVITKKYVQTLFHSDNEFIGVIKEKHLDRLNKEHNARKGLGQDEPYDPGVRVQMTDFHKVTQLTRKFFENPGMADGLLDEYLKGYYRFLILPVVNRLTGINKLVISPDDVLNFLPFEALKTHDGKYLIEKYEVSYVHSASVQQLLKTRKYEADRKPLLAMGGAEFNDMNVEAGIVESQQDLNKLQFEAAENLRKGLSQRNIYGTIFGAKAMNYLPGTVEEVQNINNIVPGAETFLAARMTENRIKDLSLKGELKKYKILHLATHGFVIDEFPSLSGVAMSIYPDEVQGEDGFLNTQEIASLDLHADLTILSACQTALGKIYSGEGVTGLTQSLLVGGSNAALVSLWPVNDNSTMLFMTDFYRQIQTGKSYTKVVNDIKRKFIKGVYGDAFKHPNFWAPFIYVGRDE
jgi:CHAT domain-containing protein/tetratricopeptide (TPR) repeat protein